VDQTVLTTVIGTLCGVIAFLYRREAARADRMEAKYEESQAFQRRDMAEMITWYSRSTMDYARIMRNEMPHEALSSKEETTQIIANAGKRHKK
jgi:hypothetical protein